MVLMLQDVEASETTEITAASSAANNAGYQR